MKTVFKKIDGIILSNGLSNQQTKCNKVMPLKVNVFSWRVVKKSLPVRSELDKRGINYIPYLIKEV